MCKCSQKRKRKTQVPFQKEGTFHFSENKKIDFITKPLLIICCFSSNTLHFVCRIVIFFFSSWQKVIKKNNVPLSIAPIGIFLFFSFYFPVPLFMLLFFFLLPLSLCVCVCVCVCVILRLSFFSLQPFFSGCHVKHCTFPIVRFTGGCFLVLVTPTLLHRHHPI